MDPVERQYEAYPYPGRDPADETRRLVVGSPSHPIEIDHFLFRGQRDWRAPMRVLVAGGGTGDALVMLAQMLAQRGTPAEIHYLDMSRASRGIAEARIEARGLSNVSFHTGDLLTAPELGPFDYIDCCGVLHHLPDPSAGFRALSAALAPDGGMGGMVYAPDGRRGVYELQAALAPLVAGEPPEKQVEIARAVLRTLPKTHAFAQNALVRDHLDDDAGLYDLLLHSRDRPFRADELIAEIEGAGMRLAGFLEPARYEPDTYLSGSVATERILQLDFSQRAALAERLAGNIKLHVFYATRSIHESTVASMADPRSIPIVHGALANAVGSQIAKRGFVRYTVDGLTIERKLERSLGKLVELMNGGRSVEEIARVSGLDLFAATRGMATVERALSGFNLVRCSRFLKG